MMIFDQKKIHFHFINIHVFNAHLLTKRFAPVNECVAAPLHVIPVPYIGTVDMVFHFLTLSLLKNKIVLPPVLITWYPVPIFCMVSDCYHNYLTSHFLLFLHRYQKGWCGGSLAWSSASGTAARMGTASTRSGSRSRRRSRSRTTDPSTFTRLLSSRASLRIPSKFLLFCEMEKYNDFGCVRGSIMISFVCRCSGSVTFWNESGSVFYSFLQWKIVFNRISNKKYFNK